MKVKTYKTIHVGFTALTCFVSGMVTHDLTENAKTISEYVGSCLVIMFITVILYIILHLIIDKIIIKLNNL